MAPALFFGASVTFLRQDARMSHSTRFFASVFAMLAGCSGPSATVDCQPQPGLGYQCVVAHTGGSGPINLCWTLAIDCRNGTRAKADACQTVEPHGKASKLIALDQIENAAACDLASGVSVVARVGP